MDRNHKRYEGIHPNNLKLLERYELICKNKGLTMSSVAALCNFDLPVFLRYIGDMELKDVDNKVIEDFLAYCSTERENESHGLSRKYNTLNGFFETMMKKDYFPPEFKNPMWKVDRVKERSTIRGYLRYEEVHEMLDYLESINDKRNLAIVSLFFSSAIRLSELHQLNRKDLDFENRRFIIIGKGKKPRSCMFSEYAKDNILEYLATRNDDLEALFISRQRNRLSTKAIQCAIKNAAQRAGIEKNTFPHLLRHSRAMHLLKQGLALNKIQIILGHASVATTQIYARDNMDDVQSIVDSLDTIHTMKEVVRCTTS